MVKKVDVKVRVKVVFDELKKQFKDPAVRRKVAKSIRGTSTFPKPPPDDTKKVVNAVAIPELAKVIADKVQNKPLPIQSKDIPKLSKDIQITIKKTPWYKDINNYFKVVVITYFIIKSLQYLSKLRSPQAPVGRVQQRVQSPTRSPPPHRSRSPPRGRSRSRSLTPNLATQEEINRKYKKANVSGTKNDK